MRACVTRVPRSVLECLLLMPAVVYHDLRAFVRMNVPSHS